MDGANRHDLKLLAVTLDACGARLSEPSAAAPQQLCLDAAYDVEPARAELAARALEAHIVPRSEEARLLKAEQERPVGYRARRWVVERTHAWMNRFRRLLVRWEKCSVLYLGFCQLACAVICCRRLPLSG